jgi:hypothetical protein
MALEDLMPGRTKKRLLKRKNGEDTPPATPMQGPEPVPTVRVRMLRTVNSRFYGRCVAGHPVEVPVEIAREWIVMGLAEQDKMIDQAPEVK